MVQIMVINRAFLSGAVMTAPLTFDAENVGFNRKTIPFYPEG